MNGGANRADKTRAARAAAYAVPRPARARA